MAPTSPSPTSGSATWSSGRPTRPSPRASSTWPCTSAAATWWRRLTPAPWSRPTGSAAPGLWDSAPGPDPGQDGRVYDQIIYEVDDPVAVITLNRPEALNAWTMRMAAEVRHAVYRAEKDPAVVGIVITGAGRG